MASKKRKFSTLSSSSEISIPENEKLNEEYFNENEVSTNEKYDYENVKNEKIVFLILYY